MLRATGNASLWVETGPDAPEHPELDRDLETDVAVIGGGIVGVTLALLLKEAGARVALIEADRIGLGVTGHTTAKVSSQHGFIYERLATRFGPDGAATAVRFGNVLTARLQSGYLYTYALVMLLGLAAAATWAMAR